MSELKRSQKERIMAFIKKNGSITNRDAARMEIYRLSARVLELREEGKPIACEMVYGKDSKYGKYFLKA